MSCGLYLLTKRAVLQPAKIMLISLFLQSLMGVFNAPLTAPKAARSAEHLHIKATLWDCRPPVFCVFC